MARLDLKAVVHLRATPGDIQYITRLYKTNPTKADAILGMTPTKRTHLRQAFARGRVLFGPRMVRLGDQWLDLLEDGPLKAWQPAAPLKADDLVWEQQLQGTFHHPK